MIKAKVGDKVRIVKSSDPEFYEDGAEGIVLCDNPPTDGVEVLFTSGWVNEDKDNPQFYVFGKEYKVISNESKTQTKKEKEMGNQIRMKQGVYAVVDTANGEVLAVDTVREDARSSLQRAKNNGVNAKLVKMQPQKWVR